ncbi:MAG: response regulator transcription factor [Deltaproteobacteria bacterium]|nr:response regulator transcription factor [Deltaproteobacteria bacterium]
MVDGDDGYREELAAALGRDGYRVVQCSEAQPAWEEAVELDPAMIISELTLPDSDGMALLRMYRRAFPERTTQFIVLSRSHEPDQIVRSLEQGADDHWSKVHNVEELAVRVGTALRRRRSFARNWRRDASHLAHRR